MSEFVRHAADVSGLPKAPDVHFDVEPDHITAEYCGFLVDITPLNGGARVAIDYGAKPYARLTVDPSDRGDQFHEDTFTGEVTGLVAGLLWSAWRNHRLREFG